MDTEDLKYLIVLISGASIPIITTYFNNKSQIRRDIMKYENDMKMEIEKRHFEESKNYRDYLIKSIEEVHGLLSHFQHSISLTSSVIDSLKNMRPEEFDVVYQKELEQLIILKSIIFARFPEFYDIILKVVGHHNNYWGHQRLLLYIDKTKDRESFRTMQMKVIEIADETNKEIYKLIVALRSYSEKTNWYAT